MSEEIIFETFVDAARQHVTSNKTIKAHEEKKEAARDYLLKYMTDLGEKKKEEGGYKCSVSHTISHSLNHQLLKEKKPELFDAYANVKLTLTPEIFKMFSTGQLKSFEDLQNLGVDVEKQLDEKKLQNAIDLDKVDKDEIAECIVETKNYWTVRVSNGG